MKREYFLVILVLAMAMLLISCGEGNKKQSVLTLSPED